jgi:hypothetical protein
MPPRDVRQPDLVEERRALFRHHDFWDPQQPNYDKKRASARAADVSRRDDGVPIRTFEAKVLMHKASILSVDGLQVKPERVMTRVTTKFLLRDLRRCRSSTAAPGPMPRTRSRALLVISRKMNERSFRRRQQRRQAHPLERQRIPHRRRARQLDAAADVL